MTVENQFPYQSFTANGSQTNFALGFYVDDKDHFDVKKNDQAVTKNDFSYDKSSNSIIFNTSPNQDDVIEVKRITSADRATTYATYNNSFRPEVLNKDIDRIWLKIQELGVADELLKIYTDRLHIEQKSYIDNQDQTIKQIIADLRNYVNQQDNSLSTDISNLKAYVDTNNNVTASSIINLRTYVDTQDNNRNNYFTDLIQKQSVSLQQLNDYYNHLMQRIAAIAVDKGWEASFVVDQSGKTQQQINNITAAKTKSVLDYGAVSSVEVASDEAFAAAISALKDGDTLTIDGDFYLEKDWIINKEINLDVRGNIYLNNTSGSSNQNSIIFKQDIFYTATGSDLTQLPKQGDSQLYLSESLKARLGRLSEYCVTLESTEILTNRLGFTLPYYKNEYNHIVSNEGHLAANLDINYIDASALKINFIRKQRLRTVSNLIPKIKGLTTTTRKFLVQQLNTSNMIFNSCGIEKPKGSIGEGWAVTRSGLNTYNQPIAINTNASGGDAYAFSLYINGFNTFNQPRHISSDDTAALKFFSGRHSKKNKVTGLQGALDEHWGYDLTIEDTDITSKSVISWAGGSLTLRNVNRLAKNSRDPLVMLRADTPTADGELIVENSNIAGALLYATRSSLEPTKGIRRKTFDRIIVKNSTLLDYGYQNISLRGYNTTTYTNDIREKTELILENIKYKRVTDAGIEYGLINNNIQAGWNTFSKVTLNNVVPEVMGTDTVSDSYYLLRYVQTDLLDVINCPNFTAQGLVVGRGKVIGGSVGTAQGGLSSVTVSEKFDYIGTTLNSEFRNNDGISGDNTIGYIGCTINTDKIFNNLAVISNMFGNVYGSHISSTLYSQNIDITNYTHQNRRKQLQNSLSTSSATTIATGEKSSERTVSCIGARIGDFVTIGITYVGDVSARGWVSTNNNVTYIIINNTASDITIPANTTINVKVSKI